MIRVSFRPQSPVCARLQAPQIIRMEIAAEAGMTGCFGVNALLTQTRGKGLTPLAEVGLARVQTQAQPRFRAHADVGVRIRWMVV